MSVIHYPSKLVNELRKRLDVGLSVASELIVLGGGDVDMVEESSLEATGLDQCKANIIDKRFRKLEEQL